MPRGRRVDIRVPKKALDYKAAADEYGTFDWFMYKAFSSGAVPSFTLNGKFYCLRTDLEKWFASMPGKRIVVR
jgi:hypothetical protein